MSRAARSRSTASASAETLEPGESSVSARQATGVPPRIADQPSTSTDRCPLGLSRVSVRRMSPVLPESDQRTSRLAVSMIGSGSLSEGGAPWPSSQPRRRVKAALTGPRMPSASTWAIPIGAVSKNARKSLAVPPCRSTRPPQKSDLGLARTQPPGSVQTPDACRDGARGLRVRAPCSVQPTPTARCMSSPTRRDVAFAQRNGEPQSRRSAPDHFAPSTDRLTRRSTGLSAGRSRPMSAGPGPPDTRPIGVSIERRGWYQPVHLQGTTPCGDKATGHQDGGSDG